MRSTVGALLLILAVQAGTIAATPTPWSAPTPTTTTARRPAGRPGPGVRQREADVHPGGGRLLVAHDRSKVQPGAPWRPSTWDPLAERSVPMAASCMTAPPNSPSWWTSRRMQKAHMPSLKATAGPAPGAVHPVHRHQPDPGSDHRHFVRRSSPRHGEGRALPTLRHRRDSRGSGLPTLSVPRPVDQRIVAAHVCLVPGRAAPRGGPPEIKGFVTRAHEQAGASDSGVQDQPYVWRNCETPGWTSSTRTGSPIWRQFLTTLIGSPPLNPRGPGG